MVCKVLLFVHRSEGMWILIMHNLYELNRSQSYVIHVITVAIPIMNLTYIFKALLILTSLMLYTGAAFGFAVLLLE